jgi:phage terminase large subunit-like protein
VARKPADHVDVAKRYAQKVLRDKQHKRYGLLIYQAADRFLRDLKRARRKTCPFLFDRWHANDVCLFIEELPHVEGQWDSPNIVLHESHVFFLVQLFGFRLRKGKEVDGWGYFRPRRFTSALFAVARKNAKSTLAAGIMLYCQCCEPEPGAQVITAATTYDQASIIFKIAKRMVEKTADLRDEFDLTAWAKAITRDSTGATFKALHAKASTQDGLNPSHVSLDEIHAHKSPDLVNVLTSAAGGRGNPLWLYTTTEGYVSPGPWGELRRLVKRMLAGVFGNDMDHFLAVFYAVDEENKTLGIEADDDFDESAWRKANPLMDVNPHLLSAIRKEALEAKEMPSKLAEFKIKRLNRPASSAEGWIDLTKWEQCSAEVPLDDLVDVPCYGGLDLASTMDVAAFRLIWIDEGVVYTFGWRWCPKDAVRRRTERGTEPYSRWVEDGFIIATEGNVIDSSVVEATIVECCERFNVQEIGYDNWNATDIVQRLLEFDVPLVEFRQGPKSYHPALQALERCYISGRLAHGGDPVLHWMASNVVVRRDANLNMAPDKSKSADKIDDIAALAMAFGVSLVEADEDISEFLNNPVVS